MAFKSESLPREGASAAVQGASPSAPRRKRVPKGRPTSGFSEQVLFPIFTVLRPHQMGWFRVRTSYGEWGEKGSTDAAGVRRKKARRSPSLMSRSTLQPSHASRGIAVGGGGGGSIGVARSGRVGGESGATSEGLRTERVEFRIWSDFLFFPGFLGWEKLCFVH